MQQQLGALEKLIKNIISPLIYAAVSYTLTPRFAVNMAINEATLHAQHIHYVLPVISSAKSAHRAETNIKAAYARKWHIFHFIPSSFPSFHFPYLLFLCFH